MSPSDEDKCSVRVSSSAHNHFSSSTMVDVKNKVCLMYVPL